MAKAKLSKHARSMGAGLPQPFAMNIPLAGGASQLFPWD